MIETTSGEREREREGKQEYWECSIVLFLLFPLLIITLCGCIQPSHVVLLKWPFPILSLAFPVSFFPPPWLLTRDPSVPSHNPL